MKRVFFITVVAALFLVANQANAQFDDHMMPPPQQMGMRHGAPRMDSEQMIKSNVARLVKHLQLTEEQAAEIERIYREQADNRKKNFEQMRKEGKRPDMQQMHAQRDKERAEVNAKIENLLTPQQVEKFRQMQTERGRGHMNRDAGPGKKKPARIPGDRLMKMKEELGLTDEQITQLKEMKKDQKSREREEIKKILTPEQYEKMQQMQHKPVQREK